MSVKQLLLRNKFAILDNSAGAHVVTFTGSPALEIPVRLKSFCFVFIAVARSVTYSGSVHDSYSRVRVFARCVLICQLYYEASLAIWDHCRFISGRFLAISAV